MNKSEVILVLFVEGKRCGDKFEEDNQIIKRIEWELENIVNKAEADDEVY